MLYVCKLFHWFIYICNFKLFSINYEKPDISYVFLEYSVRSTVEAKCEIGSHEMMGRCFTYISKVKPECVIWHLKWKEACLDPVAQAELLLKGQAMSLQRRECKICFRSHFP